MTQRTENLITTIINRARIIAEAIARFDPIAAAERLLEAWQLETMLQAEHRRWLVV
jgi:hypothetical protein